LLNALTETAFEYVGEQIEQHIEEKFDAYMKGKLKND
jgi:hypothetical protein